MNKAIFLDRDGTINVDNGYVHKKEDFKLLGGVVEGLKLLQDNGFLLIIITNQSGIARGMFSEAKYLEFQDWIAEELAKRDVKINATYYCPHMDEDECTCRKPKLALFEQAAQEWEIDWEESYAIGDNERDLKICTSTATKGYLISHERNKNILEPEICIVKSLWEAAYRICMKRED